MEISEARNRITKMKTFNPKTDFSTEWIVQGINEKGIEYANDFGFFLCNIYIGKFFDKKKNKEVEEVKLGENSLSNSQIRNVFGEVKRIQMKLMGDETKWNAVKASFLLLQPKLAYAAGRAESKKKGTVLTELKDVLTRAAQAVEADKEGAVARYMNFVDFFESILAYHKAYGGKE